MKPKMSGLRKYKKLKYLGKGSFGAALLVELRANPSQKFVMKEIVIGHLPQQEQNAAKQEAEVLHQMSHSNITMYIESFVENSKLYIVMEHADGGDISAAIQRRKQSGERWPEAEVMRIFVQICLALKHVHDQNILHRDLKAQNIFLTSNGVVKLGDFGIAKVLDASEDQARTQIGTPYYLSPEICESQPYGRSSDVWSLGVVLFELLALELPFQANSLPALVHKICSSEPNYSKVEYYYNQPLIDLTKSMLNKNPDARPTLKIIVKSTYFQSHISKLLSYTIKSKAGYELNNFLFTFSFSHFLLTIIGGGESLTTKSPMISDVSAAENQEAELARLQANREAEAIREKERIEAAIATERQAKYQEEREKIRKLKMGMKKEQERKSTDNSDSEIYVPPTKPTVVADTANNNRRIIRRSESDMESPARCIEEGPRRNSGNGNSPAMSRPKSLAELQAEKFKSNFPDINPAPVVAPVPLSNYYQNNGGGGGMGRMVVHRDINNTPSNDEYESVARREFFANRAAAMKVKAKVDAMERGVPAPSSAHDDKQQQQYNEVDIDPEKRIAAIKAHKEKQKEEALELREKQLQLAHEANRLQRKQTEKAVAFEIILDNESDGSSRNGRDKSENGINELQTLLPKPRKQWGPPPDLDELQQISSQESSPRASSDVATDVATAEAERANEKNVLKRIEGIQDRHTQARQRAKEIFRLLRDKRKATSIKNTGSANQGSIKPTRHSTALAKNNKSSAMNMNPNDLNIIGVSPIKRLMPKVKSSDDDKDSKDCKSADSKDEPQDSSSMQREMRDAEKSLPSSVLLHNVTKDDKDSSNDLVYSDDSELEENIDSWLQDQKRHVTERKKREPKAPVNDAAIARIPNGAIDNDLDGDGEEDDGDLYGLQCQLAQALLTHDDEEDHDIDDVLHYFR